ncbi:hypothetical protein ACYF6T_16645 [Streptomyces sp. 7R007]
MVDPITATIALIAKSALAAKGAGAAHAVYYGSHAGASAAAAHGGLHAGAVLGGIAHQAGGILAVKVAATTVAGVTFLNLYRRATDDAYDVVKRRFGRTWLSPNEKREILDSAYTAAKNDLQARGIFISEQTMREANSLYRRERYTLGA